MMTSQPSFILPGLGSTILLAELQLVQPCPLSAVTLVTECQPFIDVEIPDPSAATRYRQNRCMWKPTDPSNLLLFLLLLGLWGWGNLVLFRLDRRITTTDLLPRRSGIVKVSKRLGELKGFIDDSLLFVIVSDLCVALCVKSGELVSGIHGLKKGRTVRGKSFRRGKPSNP